jgi:ribulose-phosphate 3-epimerase
MSVFPGFGGQAFIPDVLDKIRALKAEGYAGDVEIDGGINAETAKRAVGAGADVLVAGNAVFGQADRGAAIRAVRGTGRA